MCSAMSMASLRAYSCGWVGGWVGGCHASTLQTCHALWADHRVPPPTHTHILPHTHSHWADRRVPPPIHTYILLPHTHACCGRITEFLLPHTHRVPPPTHTVGGSPSCSSHTHPPTPIHTHTNIHTHTQPPTHQTNQPTHQPTNPTPTRGTPSTPLAPCGGDGPPLPKDSSVRV